MAVHLSGQKKNRRRCISPYVGTQSYRAPEIHLLQKQYDFAADMWSVGCCIYEMLTYSQTGGESIFESDSCFPFSMDDQSNMYKIPEENDSLRVILKKLGRQTEYDLSFLKNDDLKAYLGRLEEADDPDRVPLIDSLQDVPSKLRNLLSGLLEFNPYYRLTAKEALKQSLFDDIRSPLMEATPGMLIKLHVDKDGVQAYSPKQSKILTKPDYLAMIKQECSRFKSEPIQRIEDYNPL